MALVMIFSLFGVMPKVELESSASGVDNIVARADYLYNITWTAQSTVKGWKNKYTYSKGTTYHIPYGQPVSSGKYICWGVSIDDFLASTKNSGSVYYNSQSYNKYNTGSYSTYYAMDCSALASYCWDLSSRTTTSSWSSLPVTSYGKCTSSNVNKIQIGDALNLAKSHIIIVSDVTYNSSGNVTKIEITEQTPPETKRTTYSASELASKYSSYTIYRYNKRDSVTPPPSVSNPNPPTNVTLSKNQVWYDIKDIIVLTPSADNATTYWMSITKDDVQVLNVQLNGSYSISANDLGYGDYHAWITAVNELGGTDSNGIDFSIVGAATYTDVWTNKSNYALNETVSISVNNICAKGQVIGIDKIGYGRVITEECDSTYTISANQLGVGEYSAYFSVYNGSGGTDTKRVSFSIYNKVPTNVTLSKNQVWYDIKDTIILTPSADNATTYWMSITKDDVQVLNVQLNSSYSISANDLGYGDYHAWITAVNELGGTDSNGIDFSIVGEATYTDVWTRQPIYMLDETVSVSINTICAKGQIINIDKIGYGRVITEECDSTYTNSANQLGVGDYIAYFSVYNGSGSIDSKPVYFTVYNKNELPGDLNRDNTITISDTVIFQKYILGMQTLTQEQAKFADLTQDGIINIFDLTLLKHKLFS